MASGCTPARRPGTRWAVPARANPADLDRTTDPGKVFDLTLLLERAAEGYQALDQRTATKVLLTF